MAKRPPTDRGDAGKKDPGRGSGCDVVSLTKAHARLGTRAAEASRLSLSGELEAVRVLLDKGLSTEAETKLTLLIKMAKQDASLLAEARCALSRALEMQGRYPESLAAVEVYESPTARAGLDAATAAAVRVQVGLAYSYTGDYPKAIALLQAALREATDSGSDADAGAVYYALARIYRSISEYEIGRDYSLKALQHFRQTGDWRGLAEAYMGIALADTGEGNYVDALSNYEQALKLVGDHPAPYLLGKIYANMAGACWFLKRPHDGIRYLEKAVDYYERTEHKANAALGYNNLGINLSLIGEWGRAQAALERALALTREVNEHSAQTGMVLDSLGELLMLRGELEEAQQFLERAVKLTTENENKWYAAQALRTLSRCRLMLNDTEHALIEAHGALALAERIRDARAIYDSHLILAEAHLRRGEFRECQERLQSVADAVASSTPDLAIMGEAQRLTGMLAAEQGDATRAVHHLSRSVSIFDLLGDVYRGALAHYGLGRAYASAQAERASEHLSLAARTFRKLGARLDLARAEEALDAVARPAHTAATAARPSEPPPATPLLTLRLAEAAGSRELLLRELAAVVGQETSARQVLVLETGGEGGTRVAAAHGYASSEGARLADSFDRAETGSGKEQFARQHDVTVIPLRVTNAPPAILLISPRTPDALPDSVALEPLLRVAELGLDVCAFREGERSSRAAQKQTAREDDSVMPGFIHSSPAMTRLVEELHKIRSSNVTVLITGESGTGKELVARAVHTLSSRRSKVFVPFNCTAVPKELSEGYLFGYRRGAFTGAVSDSAGVIRTAAGGTLFLDEVGDLPLDIQPKLLRFLQEGEIQPLGEQRPVKVDVRIIAATNTDLEEMVAEGRFREDLYYRLNVIRQRVPPLRERRSEITTIVSYYIEHYAEKFGRRDVEISPEAMDLLMVCDWPGNVRQLTNEIQRIVARAEDGTLITPDQLSPELKKTSASIFATSASVTPIGAAGASTEHLTLPDAITELERRMITEALRKHGGNITRAARDLGLTRRGLQLKLGRYDMSASA